VLLSGQGDHLSGEPELMLGNLTTVGEMSVN